MTEKTSKVVAAKAVETANGEETSKKVVRRGIGNARGTTRLHFSHELAKPNGLFIGHLESVAVTTISISEESTGMPSFNGLDIPKLVLTFASNEEDVNKRHYVTLAFNAQESNVKTIPGGNDEWKVNYVFDWLKHLLNVFYLKGKELTDEEAEALSLPFEDFDENGEYVPIDPQVVIDGWRALFENFENIMNRGGKDGACVYKDKNGKFIPIWMKLLRYTKSQKTGWKALNGGELAFPSKVGEGCIEKYIQNTIPSIKVNPIKECILPKNIEKPKTPNMPNASIGGPIGGGVSVDPMMNNAAGPAGGYDAISEEAADDMPF